MKLVKESKIITQQWKALENPNIAFKGYASSLMLKS